MPAHSPTASADKKPAALGAFLTLAAIMAGHTLLETARDALFLARLPATHLAWVYLGIAALAVGISQAQQRVLDRWGGPYMLSALLAGASGITLGFWWLTGWRGDWIFYVLYIWGSVFATVVTVHFWLVIGRIYTMTEAKRVYAFIGAGSVAGAIAGSFAARALTHVLDARHLLLAASAALLLATAGPLLALRRALPRDEPARRRRYSLRENLPLLRDDPYLRRVAGLVLVSTVTFTLVDYIFKAQAKAHVAPEQLGSFFASVNVILNIGSLIAQVLVVPWLIKRFGVTRAVMIMPALLLGGGVAVALSGGLFAVLALKAADGGLRYSLHRTTAELLYVPVTDALRTRVKGLMDGLGQRGGQALGSVLIIGGIALGPDRTVLAILTAVLAVAWISGAAGLRAHYLDLFRSMLEAGTATRHIELPALDLRSLETFIAALNSEDDAEVLAALDLLAEQGRARLIPALILYHPSREVVLRALEIFTSEGRDFPAPIGRLLRHPDAEIRAAALTAKCAANNADGDRALLRKALVDPSPIVSATALVQLIAGSETDDVEAHAELDRVVREGTTEQRLALARAIRTRPSPVFTDALIALAESDVGSTSVELPQAMGEIKSQRFVPVLTQMLCSRDLLSPARAALVAIGAPALEYLDRALTDDTTPSMVLRHVPRTISRFEPEVAIPILLKHLPRAPDGMVRYKILRGLGSLLRDSPEVRLDAEVLAEVTDQTAHEALCALDWRLQLEKGAGEDPRRQSLTHELLTMLLGDKETMAVERLFRLLGLSFPEEDFERLYRGVRSRDTKVRESSRELLENLVAPPLRSVVLALVDDLPDAERLALSAPYYEREELSYEGLMARMLASRSESLRSLAAYHVGEVGLTALRPALEASQPHHDSPLASVVARALDMLSTPRAEVARAG